MFAACAGKIPYNDRKWIPIGLFLLSFLYLSTLSSQINFTGEGDLQFYFSNAVNMVNNSFSDSGHRLYCATFPGTVTCPAVLSVFMRVLGTSLAVPVLLNQLAVCTLVCASYAFLKRRMAVSLAAAGSLLPALHPSLIIYSDTCNAEIIFGALILCAFFAFVKVAEAEKVETQLQWTVITALLCGISAFFRPVAILLEAALILYVMLFSPLAPRRKFMIIAILIGIVMVCGMANHILVKKITSYDPPSSAYGWNLYVGASPSGQWNEADAEEFQKILAEASSPSEIQQYFAKKGIERYEEMGTTVLAHSLYKLEPWLSDEYIADETAQDSGNTLFSLKNSTGTVLAVTALIDIPVFFLALTAMIYYLLCGITKQCNILLVLVFYLLGSLLALMLLEVAPRYTISYRMVFCILDVCFLYELRGKYSKKACAPTQKIKTSYTPERSKP